MIVKVLLENGAEVNAIGGEYGNALQAASLRGDEVIVELLLENGAKVNAEGGRFGNALQAASFGGTDAIVKLLLENGAEVNAKGGHYGNALQVALQEGYEAIVKLLLENGAELNSEGGQYRIGTDDSASDKLDGISEHLSVPPQCLQWITCWIAAENALKHVRNNISLISNVFDKWKIQKSEYIVLAGFDESLIKSGIGYLEQIHVFIIAEVGITSALLSELGQLFYPFSSTLFTESSSYQLPVFKEDGSVWEFDELVYSTASKFSDGGSSAKTPLTIIHLSQTPSIADSTTGFSQSSSGSGEGEKNKKQRSEKGKERDTGDNDEADKDDKDISGNPEDPPGDQDGIIAGPAEISFEITSEIHLIQDEQNTSEIHPIQDKKNIFQKFQEITMHGSLTIEVLFFIIVL